MTPKDPRRKQSVGAYAIHLGSARNRRRKEDEEITAVTKLCEQIGDQMTATQKGARLAGELADRLQKAIASGDKEAAGDIAEQILKAISGGDGPDQTDPDRHHKEPEGD